MIIASSEEVKDWWCRRDRAFGKRSVISNLHAP
jgi:hypothetical protein